MIKLHRPPEVPKVLRDEGERLTRQLCAQYDAKPGAYQDGRSTFAFEAKVYGHESIKSELKRMQHDKCCFCEAYVPHISPGDVEHYRPKAAVRQREDEPLSRPGYYWLAYDWQNLLFCCERCNRRHKGNLFPLLDPGRRARSHNDKIERESAVFVNPALEDPSRFISFREEMAFPVDGNPRGEATIKTLGLNRRELSEHRFEHLEKIKVIVKIAFYCPNTSVGQAAKQLIFKAHSDAGEYAGMVRAELARNHPGFVA